jgi:hypothetical protein
MQFDMRGMNFFLNLNLTFAFPLSEGNIPTTDFEQKIFVWQMLSIMIPTVHCAVYSLPVSYSALKWSEVCLGKRSKYMFFVF